MRLELDHVVIRVRDLDVTQEFYVRVLGAEARALSYGRLALRLANAQINVHGPGSTPEPVAADRAPAGAFDLCFRFPGTPGHAASYLRAAGVEPELGPVPRSGAGGAGDSLYFRDPDGNLLELICYSEATCSTS